MAVLQIKEVIPNEALKGGRVIEQFRYVPGVYRVERKIIRSRARLSLFRRGEGVFRVWYREKQDGVWTVLRGEWVKTRELARARAHQHARRFAFSFSDQGSGGSNCAYGLAVNREVRAARTGG
jgi:hypothetical protein